MPKSSSNASHTEHKKLGENNREKKTPTLPHRHDRKKKSRNVQGKEAAVGRKSSSRGENDWGGARRSVCYTTQTVSYVSGGVQKQVQLKVPLLRLNRLEWLSAEFGAMTRSKMSKKSDSKEKGRNSTPADAKSKVSAVSDSKHIPARVTRSNSPPQCMAALAGSKPGNKSDLTQKNKLRSLIKEEVYDDISDVPLEEYCDAKSIKAETEAGATNNEPRESRHTKQKSRGDAKLAQALVKKHKSEPLETAAAEGKGGQPPHKKQKSTPLDDLEDISDTPLDEYGFSENESQCASVANATELKVAKARDTTTGLKPSDSASNDVTSKDKAPMNKAAKKGPPEAHSSVKISATKHQLSKAKLNLASTKPASKPSPAPESAKDVLEKRAVKRSGTPCKDLGAKKSKTDADAAKEKVESNASTTQRSNSSPLLTKKAPLAKSASKLSPRTKNTAATCGLKETPATKVKASTSETTEKAKSASPGVQQKSCPEAVNKVEKDKREKKPVHCSKSSSDKPASALGNSKNIPASSSTKTAGEVTNAKPSSEVTIESTTSPVTEKVMNTTSPVTEKVLPAKVEPTNEPGKIKTATESGMAKPGNDSAKAKPISDSAKVKPGTCVSSAVAKTALSTKPARTPASCAKSTLKTAVTAAAKALISSAPEKQSFETSPRTNKRPQPDLKTEHLKPAKNSVLIAKKTAVENINANGSTERKLDVVPPNKETAKSEPSVLFAAGIEVKISRSKLPSNQEVPKCSSGSQIHAAAAEILSHAPKRKGNEQRGTCDALASENAKQIRKEKAQLTQCAEPSVSVPDSDEITSTSSTFEGLCEKEKQEHHTSNNVEMAAAEVTGERSSLQSTTTGKGAPAVTVMSTETPAPTTECVSGESLSDIVGAISERAPCTTGKLHKDKSDLRKPCKSTVQVTAKALEQHNTSVPYALDVEADVSGGAKGVDAGAEEECLASVADGLTIHREDREKQQDASDTASKSRDNISFVADATSRNVLTVASTCHPSDLLHGNASQIWTVHGDGDPQEKNDRDLSSINTSAPLQKGLLQMECSNESSTRGHTEPPTNAEVSPRAVSVVSLPKQSRSENAQGDSSGSVPKEAIDALVVTGHSEKPLRNIKVTIEKCSSERPNVGEGYVSKSEETTIGALLKELVDVASSNAKDDLCRSTATGGSFQGPEEPMSSPVPAQQDKAVKCLESGPTGELHDSAPSIDICQPTREVLQWQAEHARALNKEKEGIPIAGSEPIQKLHSEGANKGDFQTGCETLDQVPAEELNRASPTKAHSSLPLFQPSAYATLSDSFSGNRHREEALKNEPAEGEHGNVVAAALPLRPDTSNENSVGLGSDIMANKSTSRQEEATIIEQQPVLEARGASSDKTTNSGLGNRGSTKKRLCAVAAGDVKAASDEVTLHHIDREPALDAKRDLDMISCLHILDVCGSHAEKLVNLKKRIESDSITKREAVTEISQLVHTAVVEELFKRDRADRALNLLARIPFSLDPHEVVKIRKITQSI
ncbi:hypothetical protein HPB51_016097 [Rhipicephalus microplus]|uniref:Uncharacterized protein n=1 Tax=Rhipicephalus microplus TaxID=6941 RepID=A0A9J6D6D5_RHIMP|nr:hypothetical protein HPB51_016097 [Rhipicephalus microplus]